MALRTWNVDELKSALRGRKDIKGWVISLDHVHRRERYLMADGESGRRAVAVDQDRDTQGMEINLRLFVRLPREGRQGEIRKKLFPALPLEEQLATAIEAARETDHQIWNLPTEMPGDLPELQSADPRITENVDGAIDELTRKLCMEIGKDRDAEFNSAEIFISVHDREYHLSNGLVHRYSQSRVYAETAFSSSRGDVSDESLNTCWSVGLDGVDAGKLVGDTAERARHAVGEVRMPETGRYPVLVDAEVLSALFHDYLRHLSATNAYLDMPFRKPGEMLVPGAKGDLIGLVLDPLMPYGADTVGVSAFGVEQKPLEVVKENEVVATSADKKYADYLGIEPTTTRGSLVVDGGSASYGEMTRSAPKVIEILQFSALFSDANAGTFGSEIRLARLFDNKSGEVTYLKGGSLSGSIFENFTDARFSKERVQRADFGEGDMGYFGPKFALLNDVSIVGD